MSQVRTRSSTCSTSTIGENFLAINCPPTPAAGTSSNAIHCSLSNTSDLVHVNRSTDDEASNQGGNFLPADRSNPDPDRSNPDPDQDPDPDQEPDEPAPHPDNFLARSLQLLANKIASIPEALKPKSTIKPRSPDVFDGSDPTKLDVFTFQCSMYMAAHSTNSHESLSPFPFLKAFRLIGSRENSPGLWLAAGNSRNGLSPIRRLPPNFSTFSDHGTR